MGHRGHATAPDPRFESEGIIEERPPAFGAAFVTLVSAPDADGNQEGGIGPPEVAVPVEERYPTRADHLRRGERPRPKTSGRADTCSTRT